MYAIFKQNEGGKWHVGTAETEEGAKSRIADFCKFWPAEYAILDQQTGAWSTFPVTIAAKSQDWREEAGLHVRKPSRKRSAAA